VARGAAQVALAAGRMAPERLGPVVLVNPDPPSGLSGDGAGVVAAIKSVLWRNPALVAGFARLLTSQLSPAKAETIIRRTVEASAPDRAFMDDPRNVADYYRAMRAFVTGRVLGYVAEQQAFATMAADAPLPGTGDWTVLLGEVDVIHDPAMVAEYWQIVLPDAAHITVAGAGRFLAMTHGDRVVAALARANAGKI
jgi:pimeloyl-ACP methyl ester carboxylesterase